MRRSILFLLGAAGAIATWQGTRSDVEVPRRDRTSAIVEAAEELPANTRAAALPSPAAVPSLADPELGPTGLELTGLDPEFEGRPGPATLTAPLSTLAGR